MGGDTRLERAHLPCEMYFSAWCDRKIRRAAGNLRGAPTVKHGICRKCLKAQLALLMSLPAPQPRPPS